MADSTKNRKQKGNPGQSHMPENSVFYEKIVPIIFVGLGVLMVILVFIALGIATGIIPY